MLGNISGCLKSFLTSHEMFSVITQQWSQVCLQQCCKCVYFPSILTSVHTIHATYLLYYWRSLVFAARPHIPKVKVPIEVSVAICICIISILFYILLYFKLTYGDTVCMSRCHHDANGGGDIAGHLGIWTRQTERVISMHYIWKFQDHILIIF